MNDMLGIIKTYERKSITGPLARPHDIVRHHTFVQYKSRRIRYPYMDRLGHRLVENDLGCKLRASVTLLIVILMRSRSSPLNYAIRLRGRDLLNEPMTLNHIRDIRVNIFAWFSRVCEIVEFTKRETQFPVGKYIFIYIHIHICRIHIVYIYIYIYIYIHIYIVIRSILLIKSV